MGCGIRSSGIGRRMVSGAGERSEVRIQRSGKTEQPEQPFNARGANETQRAQAIFWGRGAQAGGGGGTEQPLRSASAATVRRRACPAFLCGWLKNA